MLELRVGDLRVSLKFKNNNKQYEIFPCRIIKSGTEFYQLLIKSRIRQNMPCLFYAFLARETLMESTSESLSSV
jgi:hypothetical protein